MASSVNSAEKIMDRTSRVKRRGEVGRLSALSNGSNNACHRVAGLELGVFEGLGSRFPRVEGFKARGCTAPPQPHGPCRGQTPYTQRGPCQGRRMLFRVDGAEFGVSSGFRVVELSVPAVWCGGSRIPGAGYQNGVKVTRMVLRESGAGLRVEGRGYQLCGAQG
eukprot:3147700-Rhodomonas_salina.1